MTYLGYAIEKSNHTAFMDQFTDALRNEKIMLSQCNSCEPKLYFPPREHCPCGRGKMKLVELENKLGTVVAFTTIRFAPESMTEKSPYTIVIAEFEKKLRIMAHLTGQKKESIIGMKVKITVKELDADRIIYELKNQS